MKIAAVREVFEESNILLCDPVVSVEDMAKWRPIVLKDWFIILSDSLFNISKFEISFQVRSLMKCAPSWVANQVMIPFYLGQGG